MDNNGGRSSRSDETSNSSNDPQIPMRHLASISTSGARSSSAESVHVLDQDLSSSPTSSLLPGSITTSNAADSVGNPVLLRPQSSITSGTGVTKPEPAMSPQPNRRPRLFCCAPISWKSTDFRDTWLWEIVSAVFSIACMMAVVILASKLHGSWLSKWTLFLQPSTVISILVTAAQSSMTLVVSESISQLKWLQMSRRLARGRSPALISLADFDSASRGPLGALSLLYKWKPRSARLASPIFTASLVTVVALAMGPFAQQLISIRVDNMVPQDNVNSTIPISDFYVSNPTASGLSMSVTDGGLITLSMDDASPLDVAPAMQGAFFNGQYNLGGSPIDFSCSSGNCSWTDFTSLGLCSQCQDVSNSTTVTWNNPNAVLQTPGGWRMGMDTYKKVNATARSSFSSSLDTLSAEVVSLVAVQSLGGGIAPAPGTSSGHEFTVTECSITWCEKRFHNVTVINGTLQDLEVQDVPLFSVSGQDFGGLARGQGTNSGWLFQLTSLQDGDNASSTASSLDKNGFSVSIYDYLAISDSMLSKFEIDSESSADFLANMQNVTDVIANITASMTHTIMLSGNGTVAKGIVLRQQPIIAVQWAWVALPIALVFLSVILLGWTILLSSSRGVPIWKSSVLPFLYHGMGDWSNDEIRDIVEGRLEKIHIMADRASLKQVHLFTTAEGGTFITESTGH